MATFPRARGFSAFSALVWVAFLACCFYLFAWPPLQGALVVRSWKKIPAYLPPGSNTGRYFFSFNELSYYSTRETLWQVTNAAPVSTPAESVQHEANTSCYIREDPPGHVVMAVLYPQAAPEPGLLLDRGAMAAMVFVVALVLDIKARKSRRPRAPAAAPGNAA